MPFYYAYWGNKEKEMSEIMKYIDLFQYDTICECFGGSLAFSRHIFSLDSTKRFLCSDVNQDLTFFCNNFYKNKMTIVKDVRNQMLQLSGNKQAYNDYINQKPTNEYERLKHQLFYNTMFKIRKGMMPPPERICKFTKYENLTKEVDEFFNIFLRICFVHI